MSDTNGPTSANPDHHIWCNNGTYFIHLTLKWRGRRTRLRKSLRTKDVVEARRRRDRFFETISAEPDLELLVRLPRGIRGAA